MSDKATHMVVVFPRHADYARIALKQGPVTAEQKIFHMPRRAVGFIKNYDNWNWKRDKGVKVFHVLRTGFEL